MNNIRSILKGAIFAILLLTFLASCSRRSQYENQLDSMKDTEKEEQTAINGVIGDGVDGYAVTIIPTPTTSASFFDGKTSEELTVIYGQKGKGNNSRFRVNQTIPTGRRYKNKFYNCLTGNISEWCSDILCDEKSCIWNNADTVDFLFVSDEHIYFVSSYGDGVPKLYRCDFQRNNIEMLYEMTTYAENDMMSYDLLEIWYVKDDAIYFTGRDYGDSGRSKTALKMLDAKTGAVQTISGNMDVEICAIVSDQVYFKDSNRDMEEDMMCVTDLSFSETKNFLDHAQICDTSDDYMVIAQEIYDDAGVLTDRISFVYQVKTGERQEIPYDTNYILAGDFLYYQYIVSDEEKSGPLENYYTWRGGVNYYPNIHCGIARMKLDGSETDCILQLSYQDIPVVITEFEVVGEVVYFEFLNYTEFKNYYNQDFNKREWMKETGNNSDFRHYAVADLQNGTVTLLDFSEEE